jgi:hypothetical protein
MPERFIHHLRVERPPLAETATEARERLREKFPRNALRRMTHLGMLVGSTLDGVALSPDDAIVYATSYAETRALEEFLSSFPTPSPLLFQTSIHPGGVQQVLIGRQQPVARLWPLAGQARLVEQALLTALLETAPRVFVVGGEERGTWLLEQSMASARAFAFALELRRDEPNSSGKINFTAVKANHPERPAACPSLGKFVEALAERGPLTWSTGAGEWSVRWR